MPLIKRYPNRKLYDTEAKQYITLEQIADRIRAGHDVQVIDHESGEDLTTLTLSQVILDQEKRQAGFLPRLLMTNLIRSGGDTVEMLLRALQSALPFNPAAVEARMAQLVAAGTLTREQAASVLRALQPGADQDVIDESIERVLHRLNIPTSSDVTALRHKLTALQAQLEELADGGEETIDSSHPSSLGDGP